MGCRYIKLKVQFTDQSLISPWPIWYQLPISRIVSRYKPWDETNLDGKQQLFPNCLVQVHQEACQAQQAKHQPKLSMADKIISKRQLQCAGLSTLVKQNKWKGVLTRTGLTFNNKQTQSFKLVLCRSKYTSYC